MKKQVNKIVKYTEYKNNYASNKTVKDSYNATDKTIEVITFELTNLDELVERAVAVCEKSEQLMTRLTKVKSGDRKLEGTFLDVNRSLISTRVNDDNSGLTFEENCEIREIVGFYKFADMITAKLLAKI